METHSLEIPEALFRRLQKHAVPLVDTPVSVIERLADHFENTAPHAQTESPSVGSTQDKGIQRFDAFRPPDLFHTRARGAFGSKTFSNWNELVRIAHIAAFAKAKSFSELKAVTHAQIRNGSHTDSGYRFLPEIGVSVQGVDANHAWMYSLRLAQYLETPIRALIEWRHNDKAAYPGAQGVLEWSPAR